MGILIFQMKSLGATLRLFAPVSRNNPDPAEGPKQVSAMARTPAAVVGLAKEGSNPAPRFLPLLLLLSAFFWFYTTTGGGQIFVKEVLGTAYDSQAEHFLRG